MLLDLEMVIALLDLEIDCCVGNVILAMYSAN